jgi:HK97 family phage prohead protease
MANDNPGDTLPGANPAQGRIDELKRRIAALAEFIAALTQHQNDPTLVKELEAVKVKAAVKVTKLKAQLATLMAAAAIEDAKTTVRSSDVDAFMAQVEREMSAMRTVWEVEREMNALDAADAANPNVITGYALKWASTAYGAKGPTRFDSQAFGSVPLRVPLLWQHDEANPIGKAILTPDAVGLRIRAEVVAAATAGADALALARAGAVDGFSIGFNAVSSRAVRTEAGEHVRLVTRANLFETSLVSFPADKAARVDAVGGAAAFHTAPPFELETLAPARKSSVLAEVEAIEREAAALGVTIPGVSSLWPALVKTGRSLDNLPPDPVHVHFASWLREGDRR